MIGDRRSAGMGLAVDAGGGGGSLPPPASSSWPDGLIARRNGARDFLASIGMAPERASRNDVLAKWRMPHWCGLFDDHDLIAMAVDRGWQG